MTFLVLLKQEGVEDPGQAMLRVSCDVIKALHRTGFSKALAKRTRESTQVNASFRLAFNLRYSWPPTCVDLCELALTLVEHKVVRKSTQFFLPLVTQRKSTQVDRKSSVYA